MKKVLIVLLSICVTGCIFTNEDGSSKFTYSSCRITSSKASFNKEKDLQQCWNAAGDGYYDEQEAVEWCDGLVTSYLNKAHAFMRYSATYQVDSTYCPKK